jgi:hypothetical protein
MTVANTLAYCNMAKIAAVKGFTVQALQYAINSTFLIVVDSLRIVLR